MSGSRIIEAVQDAAGRFARVTIEGQTWVRKDAYDDLLAAAKALLEHINVGTVADGLRAVIAKAEGSPAPADGE